MGPNISSSFEEIYTATHKATLTLITAKCRRTADIKDIFQDTYMELFQVLQKRGTSYIENDLAFVLRLAKQKLAKWYSLQERMKMFISSNMVDEDGDVTDLLDMQADDFLTEDFAVDQATVAQAREYLHTRPEATQKVFYLYYSVGLTIAEAAKALNISESQVKNKLYRTLKELRKLLV